MSTLKKIVHALAGGGRLNGDEIYAAEVFETRTALNVALSTYSTKEPRYLLREKPEEGGKYAYWLNPNVKLPAEVADEALRHAARPQPTAPAAARPKPYPENPRADSGDTDRCSPPQHPGATVEIKAAVAGFHYADVLADLRHKRDLIDHAIEAITALMEGT